MAVSLKRAFMFIISKTMVWALILSMHINYSVYFRDFIKMMNLKVPVWGLAILNLLLFVMGKSMGRGG